MVNLTLETCKRTMSELSDVQYKFIKAVQQNDVQEALAIAMAKKNEFRALIIAISHNRVQIAEWLLRMGWDPNEVQQRDGCTPLHAAIRKKSNEMVSQLIFKGADIHKTDNTGNTPMATSVRVKMDAKAMQVYYTLAACMRDTDFHSRNILGDTLLHAVARNAWAPFQVFRDMMLRGVNVNERDAYTGRNFVMEHLIFQPDQYFVIRIISLAINNGLDVNATDAFGNTILHRMASEERDVALRWMTGLPNVQIGVANALGQTPLWIAARRGNTKVFRLLFGMGESVECDAILYSGGQSRKSVRAVAVSNENNEVVELVDQELGGQLSENGIRPVKSLFALTRNAIRGVLAKEGVNIQPKVDQLELPNMLKRSLVLIN